MNGVSHFDNGRRLGGRASFVVLVCADVLMMATASAPSPIYPLYRERRGFSVTMLMVIFAVYAAGLPGALLTVGSLSDHLGRRPVLVAALLVAAASTAIFWAADGVGSLLIAPVSGSRDAGPLMGAGGRSIPLHRVRRSAVRDRRGFTPDAHRLTSAPTTGDPRPPRPGSGTTRAASRPRAEPAQPPHADERS